jgi:hypothetical protein
VRAKLSSKNQRRFRVEGGGAGNSKQELQQRSCCPFQVRSTMSQIAIMAKSGPLICRDNYRDASF